MAFQELTGEDFGGFLAHSLPARLTVPSPTSNRTAILRQERPRERRATIFRWSTTALGLPSFLPLERAFRRPAFTLSAIRLRSSSATAPRTVKTILPVGVEVSTCSERETNSIPTGKMVFSDGLAKWRVSSVSELAFR